jgi:hypothetical protein
MFANAQLWRVHGSRPASDFIFVPQYVIVVGLRFKMVHHVVWSRGSSGSIMSDYVLDDRGSMPDRGKGFFLAPASRPVLGPTQPPIQWVPGVLSPGVKRGRGVMLTIHPHLVPRLRMSRSYTSSPSHVPPWHVAGQLYFYFTSCSLL